MRVGMFIGMLALAAVGCDGGDRMVCVPGLVRECLCPGPADGTQSCAGDGSRFLECMCPGDMDAGPGDAGGSTDAGGGTDAGGSTDAGGGTDAGGSTDAGGGTCHAGTVLTLTAFSTSTLSGFNAWICSIGTGWDEMSEPPCPPAFSEVTMCGPTGGGWGFYELDDGTLQLRTGGTILSETHGTRFDFGRSVTDIPTATDVTVVLGDYRTLRFRFEGRTAVIASLTWEPPP